MKSQLIVAAALVVCAGACKKTSNGDVVVDRPSGVTVTTTPDTVHVPQLTTRVDTINTPVFGTKSETLVVKKPVEGAKTTVVHNSAHHPSRYWSLTAELPAERE